MQDGDSSRDSSPIFDASLRDFFHGMILDAEENQHARLSTPIIHYVTEVLVAFHETARLFAQQGVRIPVLADMLSDALEADFYRRVVLLRQMGDTSLMVSGYFPEALSRRAIDLTYYRQMGELAYSQLGSLTQDNSVFEGLSEQFFTLSQLISEVSESTLKRDQSVLKLLDLYSKTGSDRALDKLKQNGVIPIRRDPR